MNDDFTEKRMAGDYEIIQAVHIAKELVSVHKGNITADSILEAGTTFTIILPKAL